MHTHDVYLIFCAFFSETLGTLSGFGSSTFFVPVALFFESFSFVLAITALLHTFGNFSKIYLFKKNIPWIFVLKLALPSVVASGAGALINPYLKSSVLMQALGFTLVLASILKLTYRKSAFFKSSLASIIVCTISGFLTGLVGTGGAVRGIALASMQLEKNTFIILSAIIDVGGDLLRLTIYLMRGYMDWTQWYYLPLLAIAGYLGALSGRKILNKLNQQQFEKIVAIGILLSGLGMIFTK